MPIPNFNLPADLPQDWTNGQIVSPDGVSVGLTAQHGYNALNQYINDAQKAINQLRDYLETAGFATQDSLDTAVSRLLPKSGGTMTGAINMGKKKITNLATPTGAADSATKGYVDTAVSGFSGLLTGGSIRKIWAGGKATNTVAHDAVITDAIILGGVFAIVIIPPVRGLSSTFDITPCVLSPVATSDGRIFTIYSNIEGNNTTGTDAKCFAGWISPSKNSSQVVNGIEYPKYFAQSIGSDYGSGNVHSQNLGLFIVYNPEGFVYAD